MTMMPVGRTRAPTGLPGLGEMLARLAAGEQPSAMPALPQPSGRGAAALMGAIQPAPLPAPVPREASASPGAGGLAPSPPQDGVPVHSGMAGMGSSGIVPAAPTRPRYTKGQIIAGILGDALAGAAGQPGRVAQMWQRQRELDDQRDYEEVRWHRERQAKREDEMRPRVEKVGDSVGYLDPTARRFDPIYTKPQPYEAYASQFGEPGTPEYQRAMNDYILRGWGESALGNKVDLEAYRFDRRGEQQGERLETQRDIAGMRDNTSRRNTDVRVGASRDIAGARDGTTRRGQDMRDATQRRGQDLRSQIRGRRVGGQPVAPDEPIARAADGTPLVVRNGKWVPAR